MALLSVSGLYKSFSGVSAVDGVSFSAEPGELLCLLGPSGCGKTTMLRMLAGLEDPDAGTIEFDDRTMNGLAPQQRGFGLMFQDLALFPHMDVFGNVAFGLRMQKLPSAQVQARVQKLLDLVELGGLASRKVHELSGGERQRVALARSLAPAPRLLMLDEPLGSLDRALRESLQNQVRRILKEVGVTSIYVTHDRDEAFTMADRLIFMNHGRIIQTGTPEDYQELESITDPGTVIVDDSNPLELTSFLKEKGVDIFVGGVKERPIAYKLGIGFCDHNHERKEALAGFSGMLNFAREVYASVMSPVWRFVPRK
jgi:ABC-type Fe3+/spermidine/putrescine transport system ATPase subunit